MGVKFAHMHMEPGAMDTHVCYMYECASALQMCITSQNGSDLTSFNLNLRRLEAFQLF